MGRGEGNAATQTAERSQRKPKQEPFRATLLRKWYPNAAKGQTETEKGFTICLARHEGTGQNIVLKGPYGPVEEGELITAVEWEKRIDDRRGEEFIQVWSIDHSDPVTREALIRYMGKLPGIGSAVAAAIVDDLGEGCLEKIDRDPKILLDIKTAKGRGIPEAKLAEIADEWEKLRFSRKAMIALTSMGLSDSNAKATINALGPRAVELVQEDPYLLCDVPNIGFARADVVAKSMGIGALDERRLGAGVEYMLNQAEGSGHICLPRSGVIEHGPKLLERDGEVPKAEIIEEALERMVADGRLYIEADREDGVERVYTRTNYIIETRLYEALESRLMAHPTKPPEKLTKPEGSPASDEQWQAVERAMTEKLSILTGSAGTGKTTALNEVIAACDRYGQSYALMSPTGKAAKRMKESTGKEASTIHRRLGTGAIVGPKDMEDGRIDGHASASLAVDVVVVDEASMLDMKLAERLFSHVPDETRVVFVGDPNQLPAVGAGSVLFDLIESKRVPTTQLTRIFRQAEDSLLVVNANRIRKSEEPYWTREEAEKALGHPVKDDFQFIEVASAADAEQEVLELVRDLPGEMGIDPDEILVTAPTKKMVAGVASLNNKLRKIRNPNGQPVRRGDNPMCVGDRVMNTKNRYAKDDDPDIMNGDVGVITEYDADKRMAYVEFDGIDGYPISYTSKDMKEEQLIPAFAATTHKLQGSEAPVVITPYATMVRNLSRNMIYTAGTRGKEKWLLVGDKDVIREGIAIDGSSRNSTLDLKLGRIMPRVRARWESYKVGEARRSRRYRRGGLLS